MPVSNLALARDRPFVSGSSALIARDLTVLASADRSLPPDMHPASAFARRPPDTVGISHAPPTGVRCVAWPSDRFGSAHKRQRVGRCNLAPAAATALENAQAPSWRGSFRYRASANELR